MENIQLFNYTKTQLFPMILLNSLIIALSAQITVPLFPVPITLQTLAILIISMLFGSRIGTSSVCIYLYF